MTSIPISPSNSTKALQQVFSKYEDFIYQTLQPKLTSILQERSKLNEKLEEYKQLETQLQYFQESGQTKVKTQVDLGSNMYVQAIIPNTSFILINVGYGFFAELTLSEALVFLQKKKPLLEKSMDHLSLEAGRIKSEIQYVQELLTQLLQLSQDNEKINTKMSN